ncbi:MAG: trypsin-like peptidase domain-containing protein [Saprospiraceae bacterium]|nr:trypsin-like peptidase domain-containing protein [Saprospiraceae bacterium]MCF8252429.1 trypsin-like peptidase domain-containing protein [Saprospiraceae bacterium]MCF8280721.1 trypsin-like peptidase domain-containing protein [Bacteroidales bacterium]MCF8314003.1 trypsin-like peptidase domain-containing protein [Saprospiraceae bacterium]MCF8442759.1 trypsin-like peptidase domain-containing protein [Saprospiraceae bacterium]
MKQAFSYVFAGMIGGMMTLGGYFALQGNQQIAAADNGQFAKKVNYVNAPPTLNVPFDFTEAAATATPAVVHISAKESEKKASENRKQQQNKPWPNIFEGDSFFGNPFFNFNQPKQGTGSGVIYTADGYIITNNHVVEFADEVEVTTTDNKTYKATVIGTYPEGDLAVLKIDAKDLPTMRIANSDEAKIGEWVLAVGNPLELNSTVTAGIISAKGRDINIIRGKAPIESFIQTDAAVNPGNSGGALVDANGRLLGINTAIATQTGYFEGYSFAIPINLAIGIVNDIIENGSYERGFLGINIADLDNEISNELGLDISQGVLVESLVDGGAAQYAGVLPNDIIVQANGKKVRSSADLLEAVGGFKAGETVSLVLNRNGKQENISVRLKANN